MSEGEINRGSKQVIVGGGERERGLEGGEVAEVCTRQSDHWFTTARREHGFLKDKMVAYS